MDIRDILSNLWGLMYGNPASAQQFSTISPEQRGVKQAAGNQALQYLQQFGGGEFGKSPLAQQALKNFQTETIPGLAERFTAGFGPGAQRSSGFQGALGEAGADLQGGLAALEQQFGASILPQLLGASGGSEFENYITPADTGLQGQALEAVEGLIRAYLGGGFGGGGGSTFGNQPKPQPMLGRPQPAPSMGQPINIPNNKPGLNVPPYQQLLSKIMQSRNQGTTQRFPTPDYNALIGNITQPRY
jgi:hypothetical protein